VRCREVDSAELRGEGEGERNRIRGRGGVGQGERSEGVLVKTANFCNLQISPPLLYLQGSFFLD
jgi:hypothetical protein